MSIFNGLIQKFETLSSYSNTVNDSLDVSSKKEKLSTLYKSYNKYYSYGQDREARASYPFKNENMDLSSKTYTYTIECEDTVTNEILNPIHFDFSILKLNSEYDYTISRTSTGYNITFNNIPNNKTIKATVKINGVGYLSAYAQILSEPNVLHHTQRVSLVSISNAPDGVGIASTVLQQGLNGTTSAGTVVIPSTESKYESASFAIPQNTKFYDQNGNELGGDISIRIGHYSATNPVSYGLFNSGWTVSNIVIDGQELGDNQSIEFISGGFFSVDVTDGSGNQAVSIGSGAPIIGTSTINPSLINPDTGNPFVVGDTMPYWRLNPSTGLWEHHSTAVVKNIGGVLTFEFTMNAFSQTNLDSRVSCSNSGRVSVMASPNYGVKVNGNLVPNSILRN